MASDPTSQATPTASAPFLIDAVAARKLLCMGVRRMWSLSICGAIPSKKIGKSRRYCPEELRAWVRAGCPTDAGAGARVRKGMAR
ncbi:MAG: hypothetical protein AABZ53_17575 [Planctomycetota bacterium]